MSLDTNRHYEKDYVDLGTFLEFFDQHDVQEIKNKILGEYPSLHICLWLFVYFIILTWEDVKFKLIFITVLVIIRRKWWPVWATCPSSTAIFATSLWRNLKCVLRAARWPAKSAFAPGSKKRKHNVPIAGKWCPLLTLLNVKDSLETSDKCLMSLTEVKELNRNVKSIKFKWVTIVKIAMCPFVLIVVCLAVR